MQLKPAGPFVLAALALASPAAAADKDRLSVDLYLDFEEVQEPRLSPDGKQIVYTRRWVDKLNDKWESALWIMNADGSKNRFLVKGGAPRWSPDGGRIAYVAEGEPRGPQVFVRYMDAERHQPDHARRARPEQRDLVARRQAARVPDDRAAQRPLERQDADGPTRRQVDRPPRIIERLNYRRDRIGFLDDGYRYVFLVPASPSRIDTSFSPCRASCAGSSGTPEMNSGVPLRSRSLRDR